MFYTDDPIADFLRHDREQERKLNRLPKCDICGEPIVGEHYYLIHKDRVCQECLDENYRMDTDC